MFGKSCVNSVQETLVSNALMMISCLPGNERLFMIIFEEDE
jgi:hypothetical protein